MTSAVSSSSESNPFCTRAVRAGALPFGFPVGSGPETVTRRLVECGWWGEIVGPHRSGKTTLLETIAPGLERCGRRLVRCKNHSDKVRFVSRRRVAEQRRSRLGFQRNKPTAAGTNPNAGSSLWSVFCGSPKWTQDTLVVVDGYEQLDRVSRWLLKRSCRRKGAGLLVTSHVSVGLPRVFQTQVTRQLAHTLVAELLHSNCDRIRPADVDRCFDQHPGNLREVFFALYDIYESRRSV